MVWKELVRSLPLDERIVVVMVFALDMSVFLLR